jgi:hypothetical protein
MDLILSQLNPFHTLTPFKIMLRRILESRREKVVGGWRRLHNM